MMLDRPVQIAYGVTDVRAAARWWEATTGAGPFLVVEHVALAESRPSPFDHSSAYGQWGDVMVELVQEHTPPLVPPGSGVHHVAFVVDSLAAATAWCAARGWPEALHARTVGGQAFTFVDARRDLGHLVELYELTEALVAFYRRVRKAALTRPPPHRGPTA